MEKLLKCDPRIPQCLQNQQKMALDIPELEEVTGIQNKVEGLANVTKISHK